MCLCVPIVLAACASSGVLAPVEKRSHRQSAPAATHIVRPGDTVYGIAWQHDLDYRELAAWNRIGPPYVIHPGDRLRVTRPAQTRPRPGGTSSSRQTRASAPVRRPNTPARTSVDVADRPEPAGPPERAASAKARGAGKEGGPERYAAGPIKWVWPTKGPVLRTFSRSSNKGLDIGGKLGQPVHAAAPGKVVYSGSGLRGYGKLIIIKHNKSHLSAYAYNHMLMVKEGDKVVGGQRIAQMGRAGTRQVRLHFEIRRNGKPVDPLRYLPKTRPL